MIDLKKYYSILMLMSVLSVICVYYWTAKYHFSVGSLGRHEFLEGEAIVQAFTSPFWLGLVGLTLLGFRQFSFSKILVSFMPLILIVLPTVLRG